MKEVILVRHAKSDWSHSVSDRDRPITDKGRNRALKHAKQLQAWVPLDSFKAFRSPAQRAVQTSDIFAPFLKQEITDVEGLYTFEKSSLYQTLKKLWREKDQIIIFGHNPAFTNLINTLGDFEIDNLPTAGIAHIVGVCNEHQEFSNGKTNLILTHKEVYHGK